MADPKIKYDIQAAVSGDADVVRLEKELQRLGNTLEGDLGEAARKTAVELRSLAERNAVADSFFKLKRQTLDAAAALDAAQKDAQAFAREIAGVETPTRAQAGQLEKLKDAVREATEAYRLSHAELHKAQAGLVQYGMSADGLAKQQQTLKRELFNVKEASADMADELPKIVKAQKDAAATAKE